MNRVLRWFNQLSFRAWLGIWLVLLFFGAMFWAKGRDPFQRIWFTIKTAGFRKAECIAVLPKTAKHPLPVALYLHGSGGSFLNSGNDLRQIAEMGIAVVGMDYNQTNEAAYDLQFASLNDWVRKQKWADTNRIAWIGYSLGAQRQLSFILRHPEARPPLLIRVAGGWIPELDALPLTLSLSPSGGERVSARTGEGIEPPTINYSPSTPPGEGILPSTINLQPSTILLLHGEQDHVFPIDEARRAAAALETNGFRVELKTFVGQSHSFDPNRLVLFRGIGECCLKFFAGTNAFANYRSILTWQQNAKPLWLFWIPAGLWIVARWYARRKAGRETTCETSNPVRRAELHEAHLVEVEDSSNSSLRMDAHGTDARIGKLTRWEIALRWIAAILATIAIAQTVLHLVPPHFQITPRLLTLARNHLIAPKEIRDFDCLSTNAFWRGKKLRTLLQHVELANYNREIINWKLDDEIYRQFVLSPEISPEFDGSMHWRRWLWESFYPRIRKESSPEAAAEIIVRHLRERVTIVPGFHSSKSVEQIWIHQITNEEGFEVIYVAALRSAGVPARLDENGHTEFYTEDTWKPAPRPLFESW